MVSRVPYLTNTGRAFCVRAVVFDLDGTLTKPGAIDFGVVRGALACPEKVGLLEYLEQISDPKEKSQKEALLKEAELEAVSRSEANEGARELIQFLRERHIPVGVVTRNCREAAEGILAKLGQVERSSFALVVTREDGLGPKPLPDGIKFVAQALGVDVGTLLVVGDHRFDIEAGRAAGALTMFVRSAQGAHVRSAGLDLGKAERSEAESDVTDSSEAESSEADFIVSSLYEAREIISLGLPLPTGKLPLQFLEQALSSLGENDPALLVPAGVGEDAAVIDISGDEVLVLSSDPITLAASSMAHYLVLVNANDVAVAGATPKWLLTTLVFPPGSSASLILKLISDVQQACASCGVSLCGGHTEISDAVTRPLVVGMMAGTARRDQLIKKRNMKQGDRILLTKRVAVEGTGLLACEHQDKLRQAGWTEEEIAECAEFLKSIGVLEEARIARDFRGVTALHDVTEGGLATAAWELGAAGGRRLRLHLDKIPVYPQTARICQVFGLDPLGLIGSGSLLITCSAKETPSLMQALCEAGIEVTEIGEVLEEGEGIEAWEGEKEVAWPRFERDEVSRLGG